MRDTAGRLTLTLIQKSRCLSQDRILFEESFVRLSAGQRPQKLTPIHPILKGLASIDENYGYLVGVLSLQLGVGIDVHLAPLEVGLALDFCQRLLHYVAEVTSLARIDHHVVHLAIVIVYPEITRRPVEAKLARAVGRGSSHLKSGTWGTPLHR